MTAERSPRIGPIIASFVVYLLVIALMAAVLVLLGGPPLVTR